MPSSLNKLLISQFYNIPYENKNKNANIKQPIKQALSIYLYIETVEF